VLKQHFEKILEENDVVIFSTTTCPHTKVSEKTLSDNKIKFKTIHLNTYFEQEGKYNIIGSLMHKHVLEATGSNQVPNIMVKKHTIGGNVNLNRMIESGLLK